MAVGDKLSHWLEFGALAIAAVGLYITTRKQDVATVEESAPAALASPATLSFGNPSATVTPPASITIGGDPIYTTYNYPPPVTSDPVTMGTGSVAAQGNPPSGHTTGRHHRRQKGDGCCCGGSGSNCQVSQFTPETLGNVMQAVTPDQLNNLFSLAYKGLPQA